MDRMQFIQNQDQTPTIDLKDIPPPGIGCIYRDTLSSSGTGNLVFLKEYNGQFLFRSTQYDLTAPVIVDPYIFQSRFERVKA